MKEFKKGDLVMVVRGNPCCGEGKTTGKVFTVEKIKPSSSTGLCNGCFTAYPAGTLLVMPVGEKLGFLPVRLKKLDAPLEDTSITTKEEQPA
jgi:hypothetical protein